LFSELSEGEQQYIEGSLYKIKRTEKIIDVIKNREIGLDLLLDLLLANVGGA
jgi:hypothetical protein